MRGRLARPENRVDRADRHAGQASNARNGYVARGQSRRASPWGTREGPYQRAIGLRFTCPCRVRADFVAAAIPRSCGVCEAALSTAVHVRAIDLRESAQVAEV